MTFFRLISTSRFPIACLLNKIISGSQTIGMWLPSAGCKGGCLPDSVLTQNPSLFLNYVLLLTRSSCNLKYRSGCPVSFRQRKNIPTEITGMAEATAATALWEAVEGAAVEGAAAAAERTKSCVVAKQ